MKRAWIVATSAAGLGAAVFAGLGVVALWPRGTSYVGTWQCESRRRDCNGIPPIEIRSDGTFDWGPYRAARWEEGEEGNHRIIHFAPDANGFDTCTGQFDGGGEYRRTDANVFRVSYAERCDLFDLSEGTELMFRRAAGRPWSELRGPAWSERAPTARSEAGKARDRARDARSLGCWPGSSHEFPDQPGVVRSDRAVSHIAGAPEPIGVWAPSDVKSARKPVEWLRRCLQDLQIPYAEAYESRYSTEAGNAATRFETADWVAVAFNAESVTLRLPKPSPSAGGAGRGP